MARFTRATQISLTFGRHIARSPKTTDGPREAGHDGVEFRALLSEYY